MSHFIKSIYKLKREQYNKLLKRYGEDKLIAEYFRRFQVSPDLHQITPWWLNYYIDQHGDFTEGKLCHHRIAQAMLASMRAEDQVEVYQYIEGHVNGEHNV